MVKWKMERREERNGITKWWKLWERGNGETKKPRKRKIGRRGNGDRENGKMEKSRSGMDSWRNGKFLLWMNGWDEQPNYWLRTTGRKQRLEGRGDGMVMTSYHSLPYHLFPPTPPPTQKKKQGTDEVAIAYSCKVFDVFKYLSVFSPWGGGREGRAAHRLQNPVIDSCLGIWFTELKPDVRWSNWKSTYTTNIY